KEFRADEGRLPGNSMPKDERSGRLRVGKRFVEAHAIPPASARDPELSDVLASQATPGGIPDCPPGAPLLWPLPVEIHLLFAEMLEETLSPFHVSQPRPA